MSSSPDLKCEENGAEFLYEDDPSSGADQATDVEGNAADASPLPRLRLSDLVGAWQEDLADSSPVATAANNYTDTGAKNRVSTSLSPYGGHVGHYPPDLWEDYKVVEDANKGSCTSRDWNVHIFTRKTLVIPVQRSMLQLLKGKFYTRKKEDLDQRSQWITAVFP